MNSKSFVDLVAWQKAHELVLSVYRYCSISKGGVILLDLTDAESRSVRSGKYRRRF
jgi:hypothetical protein